MWRLFLEKNRNEFDAVIVAIMEPNHGYDYSEFIKAQLEKLDVTVVESPKLKAGEDWRDVAAKKALKYSKAKWVWFTEQDFFPKSGFFDQVRKYQSTGCTVVAVYQQTRMHPCSIFIFREALDSLVVDFGIVPGESDHFGLIQKQINEKKLMTGMIRENLYTHLNGFSHNLRLIDNGERANYEEDLFMSHIRSCLNAPVNLHPHFVEIGEKAIKEYFNRKCAEITP